MNSRAQIIATIGPASSKESILEEMVHEGADLIRINLSWSKQSEHLSHIETVRNLNKKTGSNIKIILDLPGPRIQNGSSHTYNDKIESAVTENDKEFIKFGIENNIDYFAVSFVGGPEDIEVCRTLVSDMGGNQKIIAKIERQVAVDKIKGIIEVADAIMVARGDLGEEVFLEQIPFVQEEIIKMSKLERKPVIVATQMLFSMTENLEPTRAEVTDVANAIMTGADAVMLSDETAIGKYPIEAVRMMDKIIQESERHEGIEVHPL